MNVTSVSSVNLHAISAISQSALLSLTGAVAASPLPDNSSAAVQLSSLGQLLSSVSTFSAQLSALQRSTSNPNLESFQTQAQQLASSLNTLQASTSSQITLSGSQPGDVLGNQLLQSLSDLAASTFDTQTSGLNRLDLIGISLNQSPSTTASTLNINQNVLQETFSTNPAGSSALLQTAIKSFSALTTEFEARTAGTFIATSNSPLITTDIQQLTSNSFSTTGLGLTIDQLNRLTVDSGINNVQLSDFNLATTGVSAQQVLTNPAAVEDALSIGLPQSSAIQTATTPSTVIPNISAANGISVRASQIAQVFAGADVSSIPTVEALAPQTSGVANAVSSSATSVAATTTASAPTPTPLLASSTPAESGSPSPFIPAEIQALNEATDQTYAALIATAHLRDFASGGTPDYGIATTEFPAAVARVAPLRAIA